jgi:hypothetical protein
VTAVPPIAKNSATSEMMVAAEGRCKNRRRMRASPGPRGVIPGPHQTRAGKPSVTRTPRHS